ncbi:MAG TPA: lytic murein transglycosylase, partial [Mizugakiibacter sp.]|nr:lytic murein transglycosylase [Mizugakiibacter sp.]
MEVFMPKPKVLVQRLAWYSVVLLALATASAGCAQAAGLTTQRAHFRQAYALALQGNVHWKSYAGDLQDYPLYPYLQAAWLQARIRLLGPGLIIAYLDRYGDLLPGKALRRSWLNALVRRKNWAGYLRFYQPGLGISYDCQALQARAGLGKSLHFDAKLQRIWSRTALPAACTPLLQLAHSEGLLSPVRLWARIERATAVGQVATIRTLAIWLPKQQQVVALRFAQALTTPVVASKAALGWPNTRRSRVAASLALQRYARTDDAAAGQAYSSLRRHLHFNRHQRARIEVALALFQAIDFKPGALAALQTLPNWAQSPVTHAWQVRVALARQNWKVVHTAITHMSGSQRRQREWQYFDARALAALGDEKVANARFVELARQADYWGFLAADRIQAPYALCPSKLALPNTALQAVQHVAGLARSFAWYALGNLQSARREWQAVWPQLSRSQRQAAVLLAHRRGWVDRAIFALGQGVARNDYALRFPVSLREQILGDSRVAGVDPVWTLSIIRAESAWS